MTTRAKLIKDKYEELIENIKPYVPDGCEPFPSLDDIDVADIILLFSMHFGETDNLDEIRNKVKELFDTMGCRVDEKNFNSGYPHIETFVLWLKTLV